MFTIYFHVWRSPSLVVVDSKILHNIPWLWDSFIANQGPSHLLAQESVCYMVVELTPLIRVG